LKIGGRPALHGNRPQLAASLKGAERGADHRRVAMTMLADYTAVNTSIRIVLMALNIRNTETDRLAEQLAALTGETKTAAVTQALRERLQRLRRERSGTRLADRLDTIAARVAVLPVRDGRSADDILGYDDIGLPR
jgi:antitoxin VapB